MFVLLFSYKEDNLCTYPIVAPSDNRIRLLSPNRVDIPKNILGFGLLSMESPVPKLPPKYQGFSDALEKALLEIHARGFYNADAANINYRRLLQHNLKEPTLALTEKEKQFLQLACSDQTYKQIAMEMHLSERTIDGYRESLFQKLKVQSRVGMALEAIRRNIVSL